MASISIVRLLLVLGLLFFIVDHFSLRKQLWMVVKDIQNNNNSNSITVGFTTTTTTNHPNKGTLQNNNDKSITKNNGTSPETPVAAANAPLALPRVPLAAETMQPQPQASKVKDSPTGPTQWQPIEATTTPPSTSQSTVTTTTNDSYTTTNSHTDRLVAKSGNYHADQQATYNYTDLEIKFYQRHHDQLLTTLHPRDYPVFEVTKQFAFFLEHVKAYKVSQADIHHHIQQKNVITSHASPILGNLQDNHLVYIPHYDSSLCYAAKLFNQYRASPNATAWPHVLLFGFHADTGGLSSWIRNKTLLRRYRDRDWKKLGCSVSDIYQYLDHPDTIAAITCQWHHKMDHPKTYSIALGMRFRNQAEAAHKVIRKRQLEQLPLQLPRPRELMMNFRFDSKRPNRFQSMQQIEHNFANYSNIFNITNSFSGAAHRGLDEYFEELLQSKFILSPGGAGFDCFRNWEALFMGTIPIIETAGRGPDGWLRTFNDLPVLVLESFGNLTPQVLEEKYHQVLQRWDQFNWEKMTFHWWVHWVYKFLEDNNLPIVRPNRMNATWGLSNVGGKVIE